MIQISGLLQLGWNPHWVLSTPNGQRITRLRVGGRGGKRLYVYTAGAVYYLRRGKLRLWRRT